MAKINNGFTSIEQVTGEYLKNTGNQKAEQTTQQGLSFEQILKSKQSNADINSVQETGLKFSKHASERLEDRNIDLSDEQMGRLETAFSMASEKGIKDSLIMVDQLAFIVNIPNQTVVTAMDQTETNSNIFTNIDGAVIN